jgi:hypothetical protein
MESNIKSKKYKNGRQPEKERKKKEPKKKS